MNVIEIARNNIKQTLFSFNRIKEKPLDSLGQIFPVCMVFTSLLGFVFAIIMFAIKQGFATQLSILKENTKEGLSEAFTCGNVAILTVGIVSWFVLGFLFVEIVVLFLAYWKSTSKVKRVVFLICVSVGTIFCGIVGLFMAIESEIIDMIQIKGTLVKSFVTMMMEAEEQSILIIFTTLVVLGIVSIITYIVLLLISTYGWMLKNSAIALLISYGVFPLLLLLVENIIPIIANIVALIILVCIIVVAIYVIATDSSSPNKGGATAGNVVSKRSKGEGGNNKMKNEKDKKKKDVRLVDGKDHAYIHYYNEWGGYKLYKAHGILHDYVAKTNGIADVEVCSLKDLQRGKFHIYDAKTLREIDINEIPWQR